MQNLLVGDCRELLKILPENSFYSCVTSPPYFGLRDYGIDEQIGLEETPDQYVEQLVEVFKEVRRVLRPDGTLWLNLGDSYAGSGKGRNSNGVHYSGNDKQASNKGTIVGHLKKCAIDGLKPKDLIGIPWRVAFALQSDGWYLRQDIIWNKPNPMPESVKDRCTKAHEYIFLLSKTSDYYFDSDAIKEPTVTNDSSVRRRDETKQNNTPGRSKMSGLKTNNYDFKNKRSVWTVPTYPLKEAHFAAFPPDLIESCVLAGCPVDGTILDPFFGAGTVGLVAEKHKRKWIGLEINPEYAAIAQNRIIKARAIT